MQMWMSRKEREKKYHDADGWLANVLHADVDVLRADADE